MIWLPLELPMGIIDPKAPREMHRPCGPTFAGPFSGPRASLGIAAVRLRASAVN